MNDVVIVALTVGLLGLTAFLRSAYLRIRRRRLPKVTEWQARKNAAPLSHAIMSTSPTEEKK